VSGLPEEQSTVEHSQTDSSGFGASTLSRRKFIGGALALGLAAGGAGALGMLGRAPEGVRRAAPLPTSGFYASYTRLDSGEAWERFYRGGPYSDVYVNLGKEAAGRFYFWRASSYHPRWETEAGSSYVDEVLARSGDGEGRQWDFFNRHSHVRIIESSEERVMVHWRYAPSFEMAQRPEVPNWTGWVDEYYTIRPDGTVTRVIYDHDEATAHTYQLLLQEDGTIATESSASEDFTRTPPATNSSMELPTGEDVGFGATYTKLGYTGPWHSAETPSEVWNECWQVADHPDVVVHFDGNANKWVFWRGTNFVAHAVSENGVWYTNEFNETWERDHMETDGAEPMSDKQNRYAHVRILESTPARALVHYRYALVDNYYNLVWREGSKYGWADWADFYYYIYPDGVAVQKNTIWSNGARREEHEFQETIVTHSPGRTPADNIETRDAVTIANLAGQSRSYDWKRERYGQQFEEAPSGANIQVVNLKGTDYDAFTIVEPGPETHIQPYDDPISRQTPGDFTWWNHWPVNIRNVFGNDAEDADEPSHSSLTHMFWPYHDEGYKNATKILLMGLSNMGIADVAKLGKSWQDAPVICKPSPNIERAAYDKAQRAYVIDRTDPEDPRELSFVLKASEASPLVNCCLVVRNWASEAAVVVRLGREQVEVEQGVVRDTDGIESLVVWVSHKATEPVDVAIKQEL
jgi:hypothetical protein